MVYKEISLPFLAKTEKILPQFLAAGFLIFLQSELANAEGNVDAQQRNALPTA